MCQDVGFASGLLLHDLSCEEMPIRWIHRSARCEENGRCMADSMTLEAEHPNIVDKKVAAMVIIVHEIRNS